MQEPPTIAQVAVELPLEHELDYRIPPDLRQQCRVGQRVLVPLGQRQILGYIVGLTHASAVADPKELLELLDDAPLLTPEILRLTRWMAQYYMCPWGQVLKATVPEGFRVQSDTVYALTQEAQAQPQTWPQAVPQSCCTAWLNTVLSANASSPAHWGRGNSVHCCAACTTRDGSDTSSGAYLPKHAHAW